MEANETHWEEFISNLPIEDPGLVKRVRALCDIYSVHIGHGPSPEFFWHLSEVIQKAFFLGVHRRNGTGANYDKASDP
jgi:hypothetical protein